MKHFLLTIMAMVLIHSENAISQPLPDSERSKVAEIVDPYAARFIEAWGCTYSRGSVVITSKETLGDSHVYSGRLSYRSGNCGSVNANMKAEFRLSGADLYFVRLDVSMPYCVFGNVLRYDPEYKDYYQKVDNFLSSSAATPKPGSSDVDINIPETGRAKSSAYALIIGNEDYSGFQTGLSKEVNVDFALNDAKTFAQYCIKTLGVPERQVKILTNATAAQIKQGLAWISDLAEMENGNAELFFYYSGHGLPHEITREPYLMPVDVSGGQIELAIPLTEVYASLAKNPVKRNLVFLDACFSGGARNQALITAKTVRLKPKETAGIKNTLGFSSSTGDESSGVYTEKQHGYFTYFLLKKIQETNGNCTFGELHDYLNKNVLKETILAGKKQTPGVLAPAESTNTWKQWTF